MLSARHRYTGMEAGYLRRPPSTREGLGMLATSPRGASLPRAAAIAIALLVAGSGACRHAATPRAGEAARERCDPDLDASLQVRNFSGRVVEVFAAHPQNAPALLAQVSPGSVSLVVPGPVDQTVRYDAIDPAAQRLLVRVSWLRPSSRATNAQVMLDLVCATRRAP